MNNFLIVINTHNNFEMLLETLDSLLEQNYPDKNYLIVINDTSICNFLSQFLKKHKNTVVIRHECRLDMANNWNRSINASIKVAIKAGFNFDYLGLFHDDDIYYRNLLKTFDLNAKHNISILTTRKKVFGVNLFRIFFYYLQFGFPNSVFVKEVFTPKQLITEITRKWFRFSTPCMMFERGLINNSFYYRNDYGPALDVDHFFRQLDNSRKIFISRSPLFAYRLHVNSETRKTIGFKKLFQELRLIRAQKRFTNEQKDFLEKKRKMDFYLTLVRRKNMRKMFIFNYLMFGNGSNFGLYHKIIYIIKIYFKR
jgi:glycosyltransferase involved in cell wall biosynthesis